MRLPVRRLRGGSPSLSVLVVILKLIALDGTCVSHLFYFIGSDCL